MSDVGAERHALVDRRIREVETQAADDLATLRRIREQWDEYHRVMRENTRRFEEAGSSMAGENHLVQRGLASRREVDSYVGRLVREQDELLRGLRLGERHDLGPGGRGIAEREGSGRDVDFLQRRLLRRRALRSGPGFQHDHEQNAEGRLNQHRQPETPSHYSLCPL